jgi:hypothetical protein
MTPSLSPAIEAAIGAVCNTWYGYGYVKGQRPESGSGKKASEARSSLIAAILADQQALRERCERLRRELLDLYGVPDFEVHTVPKLSAFLQPGDLDDNLNEGSEGE